MFFIPAILDYPDKLLSVICVCVYVCVCVSDFCSEEGKSSPLVDESGPLPANRGL